MFHLLRQTLAVVKGQILCQSILACCHAPLYLLLKILAQRAYFSIRPCRRGATTRPHDEAQDCSFDMPHCQCSSAMAQHCWAASRTGYPDVWRVLGAIWFA